MRLRRLSYLCFILIFAQACTQVALNPDPMGVVEIPDPNLKQIIREALELPGSTAITRQEMLRLEELTAKEAQIENITGLEYATNLRFLVLSVNQIRNITPLTNLVNLDFLILRDNPIKDLAPIANLTKLTYLNLSGIIMKDLTPLSNLTQLKELHVIHCQITDITPLANLTQLVWLNIRANRIIDISPLTKLSALEKLSISRNKIVDINPLANLAALKELQMDRNQIADFSPLANLVNLEKLWIDGNPGADFTPLQNLNLTDFRYNQSGDMAPLLPPVRERIANRSFPSIHQAWDNVVGLDHLTSDQRYALHDLHWSPFFGLSWQKTTTEPTYGLATSLSGDLARAREIRQRRLDLNPNMVFLVEARIHNHLRPEAFPPDSDFWLRDAQGNKIKNAFNEYLINFLKPEVQALIVKRIVAIARCGLYDGVVMNGFFLNGIGFLGRHLHSATDEEIIIATENILRTIRSQVRDDFLILINTHRSPPTRYAEYVNGSFIDTLRDYNGGYTHSGLAGIESTLLWSEENLRLPHINCVEGWGMTIEPPDGPNNRRWMRVFTTMSLTHSDGYVLYNFNGDIFSDPHHRHLWYPFWDAPLGQPVGPKAQLYKNIQGLFIREFTNGWAVYNRSGKVQTIALSTPAAPVSDREDNAASMTHLLPDLDGEIYLETKRFADVNHD